MAASACATLWNCLAKANVCARGGLQSGKFSLCHQDNKAQRHTKRYFFRQSIYFRVDWLLWAWYSVPMTNSSLQAGVFTSSIMPGFSPKIYWAKARVSGYRQSPAWRPELVIDNLHLFYFQLFNIAPHRCSKTNKES